VKLVQIRSAVPEICYPQKNDLVVKTEPRINKMITSTIKDNCTLMQKRTVVKENDIKNEAKNVSVVFEERKMQNEYNNIYH